VTIEDILEEIVGEITDEYDVERPPIERIDADTARVSARLAVEDLGELFDVSVPDRDDVETVGGLLAESLGRVPIPGAKAEAYGLELVAENAGGRRNRIDTVLVRRLPNGTDGTASTASTDHAAKDAADARETSAAQSAEAREVETA
jgi:CBS domain containing-hemolysin-like protein